MLGLLPETGCTLYILPPDHPGNDLEFSLVVNLVTDDLAKNADVGLPQVIDLWFVHWIERLRIKRDNMPMTLKALDSCFIAVD